MGENRPPYTPLQSRYQSVRRNCFHLWQERRDRFWAFRGTLAAGILMVAALSITLTVNVPIDDQIKSWTPETLPSDWAAIR